MCQVAVVVLLSVMVPATLIEDGETLPAVGQTAVFALGFSEADPANPWPGVMQLDVVAEPRLDPRRGGPLMHERGWDTWWPTLLRGDGWAAGWTAPWPAAGPMTVEGTLDASWDVVVGPGTRASGWVRRVRVMSHTVEQTSRGAPLGALREQRVPGTMLLRDVTTSPRWFTRGAPGPPRARPASWTGEDGVLVDFEVGAAL